MTAGRPTKLTEDVRENIVSMIRAGNYVETAAAYVGVGKTTLYGWLKRGRAEEARLEQSSRNRLRQSEEPFVEFVNAVQKALAYSEINDLNMIRMAGETNWQAVAWRLERRFPEKWGRKDKVEMEANLSGEVKHRVAPDLDRLSTEELLVLEKALQGGPAEIEEADVIDEETS